MVNRCFLYWIGELRLYSCFEPAVDVHSFVQDRNTAAAQ